MRIENISFIMNSMNSDDLTVLNLISNDFFNIYDYYNGLSK